MKAGKAIARVIVIGAALAAGAAWAHPGHGQPGSATTLIHLLTEPDHVLALLSVSGLAVAGIAASSSGREESRRRNQKRRGE
jgi:hydrogenase/urease accessory protein HupE